MQFSKMIVAVAVICLSTPAMAQGTSVSSTPETSSMAEQMGNNSWNLGIGYGLTTTKFNHRETSNTANFGSLGTESGVSSNQFQLNFAKEFMGANRFSFTVLAEGGVIDGKEEDSVQISASSTRPYSEKISGSTYGAGISLNLNVYNWGFRIQPFLSTKFVQESMTSNLTYSSNNIANSVITEFNMTGLEHSLGVRVYDITTNMYSFFAAEYMTELSSSVTNRGQVRDNASFELAENMPTREPLAFGAGFGFFF